MKILLLTVVYKNNIRQVYDNNPKLSQSSYTEQKKIVDSEISIWASGWERALLKLGYEVFTIPINVAPLQKMWANENGIEYKNLLDIAFKQVQHFNPDIIWYDYFDTSLLEKIKSKIKSIKLVLGWTGSAIVEYSILKKTDLVLSCAKETVEKLNNSGIKTEHLDHAFNSDILNNLGKNTHKKDLGLVFIGQIFRGNEFHNKRQQLLIDLINHLELKIYSPIYSYNFSSILFSLAKKMGYSILSPLEHLNSVKETVNTNKFLKELKRAKNLPVKPYENIIKKNVLPPVYGSEMYKTIKGANVVLNIHADSSDIYASNMRLFETTGVGTCLLTDWKENLNQLFDDSTEIVSYKSTEECLEKATWLLENGNESIKIGKQGQARTLKSHTYDQRVEELLSIINKNLL